MNKKKITLKELQSLCGALNHCCYIIPGGRAFLRRLINLTCGPYRPNHHIRLNNESRADLRTWYQFLTNFNGKVFFPDQLWVSSDKLALYTDASSSIGYGAMYGNQWLHGTWPPTWYKYPITVLEMYPIFAALQTWGSNGQINA